MKKQSKNSAKSLWQEFTEFLSILYWQGAENDLPEETIQWEWESFKASFTS